MALRSQSDTPQSVGLLRTSDQPAAEDSTRQHTTLTTDRPPCPQQDTNPKSQQAGGRKLTPYTARPLGSVIYNLHTHNYLRDHIYTKILTVITV